MGEGAGLPLTAPRPGSTKWRPYQASWGAPLALFRRQLARIEVQEDGFRLGHTALKPKDRVVGR